MRAKRASQRSCYTHLTRPDRTRPETETVSCDQRQGQGPGQDLSRYYTQSGKKPDYSVESDTATADSRQQPDQKPGTSDRKRKTAGGLGKRNSFPHRGHVVYM